MSGPKTSRYTLTAEQMRILREQMELERRTIEEQARLKSVLNEIKHVKYSLQEPLSNIEELHRRTAEGADYIQKTQNIVEIIDDTIAQISQTSTNSGLEHLSRERESVEMILPDAKNQLSILTKQAVNLNNILHGDINKGIDQGFSYSFENILDKHLPESTLDISEVEIILNDLSSIETLPKEYIVEISRAREKLTQIKDEDFLKNFKAITVMPLIEKCNKIAHDYQNIGEEYKRFYSKYHSLCEIAKIPSKEYFFSIESVGNLEGEIKELEAMILKEREEAYITDSIDHVMIEMGYDLIGNRDVTKKNGKRFRDELYKFSEGTAVNIRYDSEGKIAMELGGLDTTDRIPTGNEYDKLCNDMESFCDDFREIENRLKSKGIVCKDRISILPPKREYAQIINTVDYNMSAEVDNIEIKRKLNKGRLIKQLRNE